MVREASTSRRVQQGGENPYAVERRRYLHVSPIPRYVDDVGAIWLERIWHHDFVAHLEYLTDFVSCAPVLPWTPDLDLVRLDRSRFPGLSFVPLPAQGSFLRALLHLPRTAISIWRAVGEAAVVHSGVAGWPYPLGWLANPIARLRGKRLVVVVESDWRLSTSGRESFKHRLSTFDPLRHWMAKWSCRHADLALFTHEEYRDELCPERSEREHVTPAVWVNAADILEPAVGEFVWEAKQREPVRLLFAGRLVPSKGVDVLLEALRHLDARGVDVHVDIVGVGQERGLCIETAARLRTAHVRVLDPVPYGPRFFDVVRRYHAVLIPSLTDEQPRILFDASAQAVPAIAAGTAGLRPYVVDGETGWLVPVGEVEALESAVERANREKSELRRMGMNALRESRGLTHRAMHVQRSHLIRAHCG